jgi:hypothetical protein
VLKVFQLFKTCGLRGFVDKKCDVAKLVIITSSPMTPHWPLHLLPNLSFSTFDIASPELRTRTRNNNNKLKELDKKNNLKREGTKQEKKTFLCKDAIAT